MNIQAFDFRGQEVRSVEENGEVFFVARDVCDVLGYEHITNTLDKLDEDELTVKILQSGGQNREMRLVSEPGLYKLIFRSNKPFAKEFTRFVTHEVLPSIRKSGSYSIRPQKLPSVALIKEMKSLYGARAVARYFAPVFGIDIGEIDTTALPDRERIRVLPIIKDFVEFGEHLTAPLDELYSLYLKNNPDTKFLLKSAFSKALSNDAPIYRRRVRNENGVFSTTMSGIGLKDQGDAL